MKLKLLTLTCLGLLVACAQPTPPTGVLSRQPGTATTLSIPVEAAASLTVWRPTSGQWRTWSTESGAAAPYVWGQPDERPVLGDYDGDGVADSALFRPSDGRWQFRSGRQGGHTWTGNFTPLSEDALPVSGDFDGDGWNDEAAYSPSSAQWLVNLSGGGTIRRVYGSPGSLPVSGDFDGDGKSDLAVWASSTGDWQVLLSASGATRTLNWGTQGDVPISGDFDGDGRSDFTVYRPSTAQWFTVMNSGDTVSHVWGASGDLPTSGDFDGDGKADYAVWNTGTGIWNVRYSGSGGSLTQGWGEGGDVPLDRPFVGRRPMALSSAWAARGDTVEARLDVRARPGVTVQLGTVGAQVMSVIGNSVWFSVPDDASLSGVQSVILTSGDRTFRGTLNLVTATPPAAVPASAKPDPVLVTLKAGVSDSPEVRQQFAALGFEIVDVVAPASGNVSGSAACDRLLYGLKDLYGRSPAEVLAALEALKNVIYTIDPLSHGGVGSYSAPARLLPPSDPTDPIPVDPYPGEPLPVAVSPYADYAAGIGLGAVHARQLDGQGVTIAVLDTGVSPHDSLAGRFDWNRSASFTGDDIQNNVTDHLDPQNAQDPGYGHGTGVATLAAGRALPDGTEIGIAPGATFMSVRICDRYGRCRASDVIQGLCHTLHVANPRKLVINMSLGGDNESVAVNDVVRSAIAQGALVVAAGGNDGLRGNPAHFPAAAPKTALNDGLVTVAALQFLNGSWQHAPFSTSGGYIDIAAPGSALRTGCDICGGGEPMRSGYTARDGTSFAAPLVAGALALWREKYPDLAPAEIERLLKESALPVQGASAQQVGAGLLNLSSRP